MLAATTVAACSSSGGGSPSNGGGTTAGGTGANKTVSAAAFCHRLAAADQKLTKLGGAIQHPQTLASKLNPVIAEFKTLKGSAPPKISTAINDLLTAMQNGEKAMKGGNPQAAEKQMMKLAPKLQHDAGMLGQYVSKQCGNGNG